MKMETASTLASALTADTRRKCVLVVDDRPSNLQALYMAFAGEVQVLVALSGLHAIKIAKEKRPDAILLDVEMPGMNGFEVCERLKSDATTADIPVLFVTALNDEGAETRGLACGAVDFINKPINPAVVRARVRTHLTLKAQADALRVQANVDGLTGLPNRRCLDERLRMEMGRSGRSGAVISALMIDVDHFKRFNDRYGHLAGDDCLRQVAQELHSGLMRSADFVGRYGGEEFCCLLPETEPDGALVIGENLRRLVEELNIVHEASDHGVVTVSIGVASSLREHCDLIGEADRQLYRAKSLGRNRCCTSQG